MHGTPTASLAAFRLYVFFLTSAQHPNTESCACYMKGGVALRNVEMSPILQCNITISHTFVLLFPSPATPLPCIAPSNSPPSMHLPDAECVTVV